MICYTHSGTLSLPDVKFILDIECLFFNRPKNNSDIYDPVKAKTVTENWSSFKCF